MSVLLIVLLGLLTVPSAQAQSAPAAESASPAARPPALQARSPNTLGLRLDYSFASGGPIGNVSESTFRRLGVRYQRLLVPRSPHASPGGTTLSYAVDLFPMLLLSLPPGPGTSPGGSADAPREAGLDAYGVGINPAGLRITFRTASRVQPFLGGSTGLAYFMEPVPTDLGKQFNFTFDVGAGVQVVLTPNLLLTVGYRYHHLSNGFRGQINPGVDASLFHFGVAMAR